MKKLMIVFLFLAMAVGSLPLAADSTSYQALPKLAEWMSGSFSSAEQAAADTAFMDLRAQAMPIWQQLSSAMYIYTEMSRADRLELPYRQRIFRLTQVDDSTIVAESFELKQRAKAIGAWKKIANDQPNPGLEYLNQLTPADLKPREGCAIYLHRVGDSAFVGATKACECVTKLRGASYVTTELRFTKDYMYSWDRGYDSTGTQVWGETQGGYLFKKIRQ